MPEVFPFARTLFEMTPVFLALLALVHCFLAILPSRSWLGRVYFILACINCVLMISAQLSWTWTVYAGNTVGTLLADYTWTVFNLLVMVSYLIAVKKAEKK